MIRSLGDTNDFNTQEFLTSFSWQEWVIVIGGGWVALSLIGKILGEAKTNTVKSISSPIKKYKAKRLKKFDEKTSRKRQRVAKWGF